MPCARQSLPSSVWGAERTVRSSSEAAFWQVHALEEQVKTDGAWDPSIAERFQGGSKFIARVFKLDFPSGRAHDDGQPAICHLGTCAITSDPTYKSK
eukprot:scaffold44889_cov83-Phaeocystis_antarctica.AAC.4